MRKSINVFVHCETEMEQIGFEKLSENLPFKIKFSFMDLSGGCIQQKLAKNPDLIILNIWEVDDNYTLPQKIKLLAPHIPLFILLPEVPDSFIYFLRSVMVDEILIKPFTQYDFEQAIIHLIK